VAVKRLSNAIAADGLHKFVSVAFVTKIKNAKVCVFGHAPRLPLDYAAPEQRLDRREVTTADEIPWHFDTVSRLTDDAWLKSWLEHLEILFVFCSYVKELMRPPPVGRTGYVLEPRFFFDSG
jgi:hypothetical protein